MERLRCEKTNIGPDTLEFLSPKEPSSLLQKSKKRKEKIDRLRSQNTLNRQYVTPRRVCPSLKDPAPDFRFLTCTTDPEGVETCLHSCKTGFLFPHPLPL